LEGTTKLRWPHNFGAYRLTDQDLARGSTLGSPKVQVAIKASGAVEHVFCVDAGARLLGTFMLRHWDERAGMKLDPIGGHFFLFPEHQEHRYMLSNGVYVFEDVFVDNESATVHYVVELTNDAEEEQRILTYSLCELAKNMDDVVIVRYDDALRAFVAHSKDAPKHARIVGASRKPGAYEVSADHAKAVMGYAPGTLSNRIEQTTALPCGVMQFSTTLGRRESARLIFTLSAGADGESSLVDAYQKTPKSEVALERTQQHYHDVLERSVAITPNPEINRGVLWAKANMERVLLHPPSGWAITNDPMNSTHCVARDAAWFSVGADYFRADFSGECLQQFLKRQKHGGMIVEYYDMLSNDTEDFGLNVNDDTPLIIWSIWHHYQMTGDRAFLERAYHAAIKAANYLAAQRDQRGLIWCTSRKTGTRGIAGWRNVIEGYRLTGATTEINSEAYAAFRAVSHMAATLGDEPVRKEFDACSQSLKAAINEHLYNQGNGLYYLNIDVDGTPVSDITADLVFPVMYGVADRDAAARIIRRLSDRDFWTPGGMRTIPHDAVNYTPNGASGCLGGVWNGVTFWYAKAAAEYIPDFSEEALTKGFDNYARNPQRNDTVPGQFSEWLHGETLVNQGMPLSPWFPPRYIWAVIEGLLGLDISGAHPRLAPNLPSTWNWCALRNLPYRGKGVTYFLARMPHAQVWSNQRFDSELPIAIFAEDISERVQCSGDAVRCAALRDGDRIAALAGNTEDRTVTTAIRLQNAEGSYRMRCYDSLRRDWLEPRTVSAEELESGVTILLEPKGFQLIELNGAY
jgi:glycogen debranching enzyme